MACEARILNHYNPATDLVLQTDASSHGLGAALLQNGNPIAYASRALTRTEQNYAQIEKECLSVVFGLERFDQYTFGRHVIVENDHKPLEVLMKKALHAIPKRLQAMRMRMGRYDVDLKYRPGPQMILPDTLSRAHPELAGDTEPSPFDCVNAFTLMPVTDRRLEELREATTADDTMQELISVIRDGWPDRKDDLPELVKPFFDVRDTLTEQDGIILKGERLVIPPSMRADVKQRLHAAHLGHESMLRRAHELIYWPKMNHEIKQLADSCDICQAHSPRQSKEPLIPHQRGDTPWQKIGIDLFSIDQRDYMVTVDYLSNFWEVDYLSLTTTSAILTKLKAHLARYGIPQVIVSDNAQFTSQEFQDFTQTYGIQHDTSSPDHSKSNGKAQTAVKSAKKLIKKCAAEQTDPYLALLELRNTPMQGINLSPAQMLLQRQTRSTLPIRSQLLSPRVSEPHRDIERRVATQVKTHDRHAKPLEHIPIDRPVLFDKFDSLRRKLVWSKGVITGIHQAPRSYIIKDSGGAEFRRNRVHIKPVTPETPTTIDTAAPAVPCSHDTAQNGLAPSWFSLTTQLQHLPCLDLLDPLVLGLPCLPRNPVQIQDLSGLSDNQLISRIMSPEVQDYNGWRGWVINFWSVRD